MATAIEITRTTQEVYYFTENLGVSLDIPLQMILIPSGTFMMGAPEDEEGSSDDEKPQHPVNIQRFFMGRYPITQEQWKAIADRKELKVAIDLNPEPSYFKEDYEGIPSKRRPVEQVSWQEAIEYCARLSNLTGKQYSLPSEAQWEYACRAGTTTPFHFGETISTDLANYSGSSEKYGAYGRGLKGIYRGQTTPVDYFNAPNAFGLSDMHGNVWEWCLDPWHSNYDGAPNNGKVWDEGQELMYENISKNLDALFKESGKYTILRGGSWSYVPDNCRSAYRLFNSRDNHDYLIGFRVMSAVGRTP